MYIPVVYWASFTTTDAASCIYMYIILKEC